MTELTTPRRTPVAGEAEALLDRIRDGFDDPPAGMSYFYDLFRRVYRDGEPVGGEGPVVGVTCIQAPEELVRAAGAIPVRLCSGAHHFDQAGAEWMPSKSCAMVKATLGMLASPEPVPRTGPLRMVVNLTTCDQKKKGGEMIAGMGYAVHDLDLPSCKESEEARRYWQASVRRLAGVLGEATGTPVTRDRLRAAMGETALARGAFRMLHRLRRHRPSVLLGTDAFLVTNAYFFDRIDRWTAAVARLNEELVIRVSAGTSAVQSRAPRILFTGSPPVFPNLKLPLLIEEAGGVIVADETCSGNRMLYDMAAVDEWRLYDMVDALVDRALKPCTCPIFTGSADRQRRLGELAADFEAEGVVYQAFSGCQVYEMEQRAIAAALAARGIPMLYVETDYSPDDVGQLATRVEAFLESIKARRRKRR